MGSKIIKRYDDLKLVLNMGGIMGSHLGIVQPWLEGYLCNKALSIGYFHE